MTDDHSGTIILIGAGGHARSCIDVIEHEGRLAVVGLIAMREEVGHIVSGYEVLGVDEDVPALTQRAGHALVAIGQISDPDPRMSAYALIQRSGYSLPVIISPRSYVSPRATIGAGSIVMHGAVVNAGAVVGANCILNSQSLLEHDVTIGDHCHVSTAATINGGTRIGSGTFIGSGSIVRDNISIGERCFIGMGQSIVRDCPTGTRLRGGTRP